MPLADVNGFRMYYEVHGEGPPVLCTTGWGTGTGHRVAAYPEELPARYRMIVYDHRGVGRSEGGLDVEPTTERYADDLAGLMDHLGVERAHVFGRGGMGGCIAQQLAIRHPDRVRSAIFGQSWARADAFLRSQIETLCLLREHDFYAFQSAASWICHRPRYFNENGPELLGPTGGWSDLIDSTAGQLALMRASIAHDTVAVLARVSCPSLIIQGGENDWITGVRLGEELRELLPDAEYVVLEEAPHGVKTEDGSWQRYKDVVMTFLADAVARSPESGDR